MSFQNFSLDERLLKAVADCGFTSPSEIQLQAIPHQLEGKDIMASAPTGTGKTAAFVLPALQRLLTETAAEGTGPRVLVLTPTRELATQVTDNIYKLTKYARMRSTSIVGGMPYPPQIRALRQNIDLVVATPGRLIDHINAGRIDFSRLQVLVLDEADRMLDMGFIDDVKRVVALAPRNRQTILFSATLEGQIKKIANTILNKPVAVQVAGVACRHESISQSAHQADDFRHKRALLSHIVGAEEVNQAIIFTATKRGADELSEQLKKEGHKVAALHGDMKQSQRRRTIDRLSRNQLRILVATDVAARGLDIKGISHVVNFDMPMQAEDYVHRIGRTGRGGATGTAISLIGPQDWGYLQSVEKLLEARLDVTEIEGLEPQQPRPRIMQKRRPGSQRRRKPSIHYKRGAANASASNQRRRRKPRELNAA